SDPVHANSVGLPPDWRAPQSAPMTFRAYLAEEAQGLKRELEVYRRVLGNARRIAVPKPTD
ncbi:MAG: hypothetical protein ACREVJ_08130, partial [Gammaproteobacteria bacterium]